MFALDECASKEPVLLTQTCAVLCF